MGRSATLCGGKDAVSSISWDAINSHRSELRRQLEKYTSEPACVKGAPTDARNPGDYLEALTMGLVSIIKEELNNIADHKPGIGSKICFGVIYAELWRQATLIKTHLIGETDMNIRLPHADPDPGVELVSRECLKSLHEKWRDWQGNPAQKGVVELASLLADAYLKAMGELRLSAENESAAMLKHHIEIVGDIYQEILALHATLLPTDLKQD
ncbi:hypothetical protein [Pseudomonas sp. NGC7]|uniref:hypothetical protein n=1 Tax=Pseudomonas sp. NGC7 TaxID=3341775 RepID=UPI0037DAAED9